jgi:hypothetical protein
MWPTPRTSAAPVDRPRTTASVNADSVRGRPPAAGRPSSAVSTEFAAVSTYVPRPARSSRPTSICGSDLSPSANAPL